MKAPHGLLAGMFVTLSLALPAAQAQDIQERTIRFGHLNNTDHPVSAGVKKFAELVAAKSGGKITVKEFPASQLGNEMQQQSALQVALGFWDLGFRNVTNSKHPVTKGEDLEGLKVRVIPNPVFLETFKTFKANPLPLPFAELYNALESKAVDGQENPFSVILSNKFYEVQKYLSVTNHVYAANIVLMSKRFWDKLSPAEQKILQDAANEASAYQRKFSRDVATKAIAELKTKGMQINELSPAELGRMRAAVKPVYDKFSASYDPAVVTTFRGEMDRLQKP
jgi:TRAP-type C4-dicarboxylate transport system substrate-binding protein